MPYDNGNRIKPNFIATTRPGFVRPKDAHRNHRSECFRDDQTEAGLGRLQIAIERARALGKHQRSLSRSQNSDQCLEGTAIAAFLINWNDV